MEGRSHSKQGRALPLVLALALALALGGGTPARVHAQVPRPRVLVGRLVLTPDATRPGAVRVALSLARPGAGERVIELAVVTGRCTEDFGGLDSFAIVYCESPSGQRRVFELVQVDARIAVDERRGRTGGGLRRARRRFVARIPSGVVFVARCAETLDDPLACPPPR